MLVQDLLYMHGMFITYKKVSTIVSEYIDVQEYRFKYNLFSLYQVLFFFKLSKPEWSNPQLLFLSMHNMLHVCCNANLTVNTVFVLVVYLCDVTVPSVVSNWLKQNNYLNCIGFRLEHTDSKSQVLRACWWLCIIRLYFPLSPFF